MKIKQLNRRETISFSSFSVNVQKVSSDKRKEAIQLEKFLKLMRESWNSTSK
jgi:ribosome maturation protein Sdo1